MKFLCPSCKAKYQIADEKVAGRSVRMKCRKCGFVIPLSEIPTAPTSVPPGGDAPVPVIPKAPLPPTGTAPGAPKAPSPAAPPASVGKPASPAAPAVGPAKTGATPASPAVSAKPAVPARRPTLADVAGPGKLAAPPGRAAAPSAPGTPSAAIPAPPAARPAVPGARPATKAPTVPKPATGIAASPAAAAAAAAVAPAAASAAAVSLLSALDEEDDENDDSTHILKGGALADAFGALVGSAPVVEATGQVVGMPADEWFAGINDVPVGPIRLAEIRKRAMLGAITPETMVWRDGLEAWRPLKTFPELLAVLEESVSSVRAAPVPLVAPSGEDVAPPNRDGDSFAAAGAAGGITGAGVVTDDVAVGGAGRYRMPVFAWVAIVVALGLGVTIGFVFYGKQKPPETIVKYVEVPAKGPATPAAAIDPQAVDPSAPAASVAAAKARTGSGSGSGKVASSKTTDAQPASTGLAGLKGLSGLGPSGPGVTGSGPGTGPASGGGQLDAAQTQSTVARYTGSVKRSCWQPALDARDPSAPTSARVMVTITVGPTGSVQNVSTNGDPRGYPGLAPCIAGRVRAWQFPATGGTTTVNVPFVFAAQ